jgi:hypothetical protein
VAQPFDDLRERLLRGGVGPRHVRRYLAELSEHLADLRAEELRAGRSPADAESAALVRLGGIENLANAMINQRRFQSWSSRAPWAMFCVAPPLLLGCAYFIALEILWYGWNLFMPGADTPFGTAPRGPIYRLSNLYFQADKFYYFSAPILVDWGFALIAVRQRMKSTWVIAGAVLVAVMGGTGQVHAGRAALQSGFGHVYMDFFHYRPFHVFAILLMSLLPYAIWKFRRASVLSGSF